ncbi:hypothetical protein ACHAXT_011294 [Thalassiosira profunda]
MAAEPSSSTVKLRSIYVSSPSDDDLEGAAPVVAGSNGNGDTPTPQSTDRFSDDKNPVDLSDRDHIKDPVQLPQSTHSLLFSEPVCSLPFAFAVGILLISFGCLGLAFVNNIDVNDVPVNVTPAVRGAQYLSILVALLMEEEIPTGLYLLRRISRQSLRQQFPQMKYRKFFLSAAVRIANGYYFLLNVLLVLIQAEGVLDIFYDVLALQFVQQLDDIAFSLAKIDVFGKSLQRACTARVFEAEFEKQKGRGRKERNLSIFLRAVYFVNICGMLAGMAVVSIRQMNGHYQEDSITVDYGETVWNGAWVRIPSWLPPTGLYTPPPGELAEWTLVYSFFNGVYEKSGFENGRPVYRERRKFDRSPYERVVPAEIKYCQDIGAWVFTHENIFRTKSRTTEGCNWLLRSPPTEAFDLLEVEGTWQVWVGVIGRADVTIESNLCLDSADCNLNGDCVDGACQCFTDDGAQFLGTHCEVKLRDNCRSIVAEFYNSTWSVATLGEFLPDSYPENAIFEEYSRPAYIYTGGNPDLDNFMGAYKLSLESEAVFNITLEEIGLDVGVILMYTGSRWIMSFYLESGDPDAMLEGVLVYHAFWNRAFRDESTWGMSDPTNGATPVGVDFYLIGERGEQFGPFGALSPMQKFNQTGRGIFRCSDTNMQSGNANVARQLQLPRGLPGL